MVNKIIQLDFTEEGLRENVEAVQGDTGRTLLCNITGVDMTGVSARFYAVKKSGKEIYNNCSVSGNKVTIDLTEQTLAETGIVKCQLDLRKGSQKVQSFIFNIIVTASLAAQSEYLSSNEYKVVDDLAGEVEDNKNKIAELDSKKANKDDYGSPLTAATISAMTDKKKVYVYTGSESGYTAGNWYSWNGTKWVSGGVYNSAAIETDKTLSSSGKAADAAKTGEAINLLKKEINNLNGIDNEIKDVKEQLKNINVETDKTLTQKDKPADAFETGNEFLKIKQNMDQIQDDFDSVANSGISDATKEALLNCFRNVAWTNENGQKYYETLQKALNSGAPLTGIIALYNGEAVPANIDLQNLRSNIVVKAVYEDGQEVEISNYMLNGNIVVGENTITVSYRKFTTTFIVTGVESYSITYNLTNVQSSNMPSSVIKNSSFSTKLSLEENYTINNVIIIMDGKDVTQEVYSDNSIIITEVTGDVIITIVASIPEELELLLSQAGTQIAYYSDEQQNERLSNQFYGAFAQTKKISWADAKVKIVMKNVTDTDVNVGDIYAGSRKSYDDPSNAYVSVLNSEKVKTGVTIGAGKSLSFEYTVKSGCRLCFSRSGSIEYIVYGNFVDKDFGKELPTTIGNFDSYKAYSDEGNTMLKQGFYLNYKMTSETLQQQEIYIVINQTEETSYAGGIIVGSYNDTPGTIINAVQLCERGFKLASNMPYVSKKISIKDGCKVICNNVENVKIYKC